MKTMKRIEAVRMSSEKAVKEAEQAGPIFEYVNGIVSVVYSSGAFSFDDPDGFRVVVKAWYRHDIDEYNDADDMTDLDWDIIGYTVK